MMCDNCGRATRKADSKEIEGTRYCGRSSCKEAFNKHRVDAGDTKYVHWK